MLKSFRMFSRFDTIPACDGQTDRLTSCDSIVRAMHSHRAVIKRRSGEISDAAERYRYSKAGQCDVRRGTDAIHYSTLASWSRPGQPGCQSSPVTGSSIVAYSDHPDDTSDDYMA